MRWITIQLTRVASRGLIWPISFLLFIGVMAALINGWPGGMPIIGWLARYEIFHIVAHFLIFGSVAVMIGMALRGRRFALVVWAFVLIGTALIEGVQAMTLQVHVAPRVIAAGSTYDLMINASGALAGIIAVKALKASERG
jgi:hypothetical protein